MGLDISALSAIVPAANQEDGYHVWDGGFAGRSVPFEKGNYEPAPGAKTHSFRAGSYGGYSHWRNKLAEMVHGVSAETFWKLSSEQKTDRPFSEQISFTDCDGTIGTTAAAKLAKDYAEWQERIEAKCAAMKDQEEGQYFLRLYSEWRRAFELAAGNGVVIFH